MLIRPNDLLRHMERTKQCTRCNRTFPISEFGKHRLSPDGHAYQCKECGRERAKIYRASPGGIYHNIKGRATFYKNHHFEVYKPMNITQEEFIAWYNNEVKACAYCDIPEEHMDLIKIRFDKRVKRLSIDCKDNNKGYSLDNLALACNLCNMIKKNVFSFQEMRALAQAFIKPKWKTQINC